MAQHPGRPPLSLASLKGKVVLVDFWTYSCINCQRSLPHVESWYARYHNDGFVVVGVHTPEFAFEHVVSNVSQAAKQLGVVYPIAVDNGYKTWDAYQNDSWPAEYLIDATGQVRHAEFGEGDYGGTESLIRTLLTDAHPRCKLPPPTDVPDKTPTTALTPESYLGYQYGLPNFDGTHRSPRTRPPPTSSRARSRPTPWPSRGRGRWARRRSPPAPTPGSSSPSPPTTCTSCSGGRARVKATVGSHTQTHRRLGHPPALHPGVVAQLESATLVLTVSPGVDAYDFTFG